MPSAVSYLPMLILLASIVGTGLWILALVDCLMNEPSQGNDKIVWGLVIALTHVVGALIYLLLRRPQRIRQNGQ